MEDDDVATEHPILRSKSGELFAWRSFGLFPLSWRSRRLAIRIVEHPYFEFLMMAIIIANAIMLALYDPVNRSNPVNEAINNSEVVFVSMYTIEMVLKMFAYGLYWEGKKGTYLKNGWDLLDFLVVLLGWVTIGVDAFGASSTFLSTLRLLRVLRPLRSMKSFPAMSWVTKALLRAVPQLISGGALFVLLSIVAAITGMTFFRGKLRQRCVYVSDPTVVVPEDLANNRFCAMDYEPFGRHCPYENTTCALVDFNPNNNITSFDNALWTAIILFQMITMEGWSDIMYWISDTNGAGSQIYFIVIVICGGIFIINVLLAVLAVNITVQREMDQSASAKVEDIKAIEQSLLERRLLSEKFGVEDLSKQRSYIRFLKHNHISLTDSMEMRLMLSYERMKDTPGYHLVSSAEYQRLSAKHATLYSEWKRHIVQVLDPCERLAAAKRDQQAREEKREWERRASDGRALTAARIHITRDQEAITPPFIHEEVKALEVEARMRMIQKDEARRNRFTRLDSFVDRRWTKFYREYRDIKDGPFVGQTDNAITLQRLCYRLVSQSWFDKYLMNACIVANVLMLSAVHYNQPEWITSMLRVGDIVFAVIFIAEMVIKMVGFGFLKYMTDQWLVFDAAIALVSLLQFSNAGGAYVAAFRSIRLLRLIRLIVKMPSMKRILVAIWKTMRVIIPFLLILMLFLFIATIIGLQLFGGIMELPPSHADCSPSYVNYPHCPPRPHFDSFFFAFVTTFQVVTKDNWNQVMVNVVSSSSYWAFLYFFGVISVGTLVVLNVFLGVLIDSFLFVTEEKKKKELLRAQLAARAEGDTQPRRRTFSKRLSIGGSLSFTSRDAKSAAKGLIPEQHPIEAQLALKEHVQEQKRVLNRRRNWRFVNHPSYKYKTCFGIVSGSNPVRRLLGDVICSPAYHWFVLMVIIVSSIAVCFESAYITPELRVRLEAINIFVAVVFLSEVVLKLFCFGVYGHPGSYVRNPWNLLDFALAIILILSLVIGGFGWERIAHMFRALYPLRIIRHTDGLRIAVQSVGRAVLPVFEVGIFICLFFLAGAIFGTLLYEGAFYSCYEGPSTGFNRVARDDICFPVEQQYVIEGKPCAAENQCNATNWLNPTIVPGGGVPIDFDSVPRSLLVLFELSALENWCVPMFAAVDSTRIGWNFVRESSRYTALFFVFFVLFFNVLLVQLFVAVIVDAFRQSEREAEARAFLTARQYEWIRMQKKAVELPFQTKELPPYSEPFKSIHFIVTSKAFKRFIVLTTFFNIGVLLSMHVDPSPEYVIFFAVVDYVVGAIYITEAIMKLMAFGTKQYFRRFYNWLDLTVCIATVIGWAVPGANNVVQFIDSLRVFGIVYYLPKTRHLVSTLSLSAPALINVASFVFLVFYVYAIVGVAVFSDIRDFPPADGSAFVLLSDYVNFENFGAALITLFRMSTGESWNGIMRDMVNSSNFNAANFAYVYCLSFIVVIQFCLLNLIVAVIMFDISDEIENNAKGKSSNVSVSNLARYSKVWADVRYEYERKLRDQSSSSSATHLTDTAGRKTAFSNGSHQTVKSNINPGSGRSTLGKFLLDIYRALKTQSDFSHPQMRMPYSELPNIIIRLPPPLGLQGVRNLTRADTLKVIRALQIPVNENGEIHYHTTLSALIDRVVLGDVINKTLKASLVGIASPKAPLPFSSSHNPAESAANADFLLDRVTEELRDLLNLQIPTSSIMYKQGLDSEHERNDGYDAAQLIATRLLHKAAARFLQKKRDTARRNSSLHSRGSVPQVGNPPSIRLSNTSDRRGTEDRVLDDAPKEKRRLSRAGGIIEDSKNDGPAALPTQTETELIPGLSIRQENREDDSPRLSISTSIGKTMADVAGSLFRPVAQTASNTANDSGQVAEGDVEKATDPTPDEGSSTLALVSAQPSDM